VYAATERRLLALDAADGAVQWTRIIGGPDGLKYVDGRLYQVDYDLQGPDLVARSPAGGESWRTTLPDKIRGVHERDGYVFVAGRDRYWTLHADTGEVVRERDEWVRNMATTRDSVYAAFSDHLVRYTVEGRTLAERWQVQEDTPAQAVQPVVTDEWIYVPRFSGGDRGELTVYWHDGEHRARYELDQSPRGLTVPSRGPVVVSTARVPGVHAMQPDGTRRWTVDVDGRASAIAADGTVYAANPLVAVDAESGDRLWQRRDVPTDADTGPGSTSVTDLAATDSTLFVASDDAIAALRG
jgi:outer membrane protein assembly factor BamB